MKINVASFIKRSKVNGPGIRSVIWVQGCPIHCEHCYNKHLWSFTPNKLIDTFNLLNKILNIEGIEGVTFTGGEPFSQASQLAHLGALLQENDLNIVTFTGYTVEELKKSKKPGIQDLLDVTDLLIYGPYNHEMASYDTFLTSENQVMLHLSPRLVDKVLSDKKGDVEIIIDTEGNIIKTGFWNFNLDRMIK